MKKILCVWMVLVGLVTIGSLSAACQAKTNFSGTWKMNMEKSDTGQMPKPSSQTATITQTADAITVAMMSDRNGTPMSYTYTAKLDGTDTPVPASAFPAEAVFRILSSKAEWQGASLVITQTTSFQDAQGKLKTTYTLSADGKTLTAAAHISFDQGDFDSTTVYDKA